MKRGVVMPQIQVLDCTLRDGGYCNGWNFGEKNIYKIIKSLIDSKVNIIECGFLTERVEYDRNISKFTDIKQLDRFIPKIKMNQLFVVMINYGEYELDKIPDCNSCRIDGIRVAFHKNDSKKALEYCRGLISKGYMVFIQPMVSMNYKDKEFIELIKEINKVQPIASYIVDSFGTMRKKDLLHYFYLMDAFLDENIIIGFHSHNNVQSALANAQCLLEQRTDHALIFDSSIYGMGRGAGNLNSELFLKELNENKKANYAIKPLLQVMDECLNYFYKEHPWGYTLPNYLSAAYMIHPNYTNYLMEKNTLTLDAIDDIFSLLDKEHAVEFDPEYIEEVYKDYMSKGKANTTHMEEFIQYLQGKRVLLIAPGKWAIKDVKCIKEFIEKEKAVVISINHELEIYNTDYIFVSNMRRYNELPSNVYNKVIATTNIKNEESYLKLDYYSLTNPSRFGHDNAGLMAIQLMLNLGKSEIWLAGYDGYDYQSDENYDSLDMALVMSAEQIDTLNKEMEQVLSDLSDKIALHFITETKYKINNSNTTLTK